jgi:hypothetical protein
MQAFASMQAPAHCVHWQVMTWSAKGWAAHDSSVYETLGLKCQALHVAPGEEHIEEPTHWLFKQVPEQQSGPVLHAPFDWAQAHWFLEHAAEQQSLAAPQLAPTCPHVPPTHAPLTQRFEQQSLAAVHAFPVAAHATVQTPLLQTLVQQSVVSLQLSPVAAQATPHLPAWQVSPLQQPFTQLCPSAPHTVHVEFAQVPLQHSEYAMQAMPPGLHAGVPVLVLVLDEPPLPPKIAGVLPHAPVRQTSNGIAKRSRAKVFIWARG